MKACLLTLLLLLAADLASATDWRYFQAHADEAVTLYYDKHSVRESGGILKMRVKRVFSEDEGRERAADRGYADTVAYTIESIVLNCDRKLIATQRIVWYGKSGKVLDRGLTSGYAWRKMRPQGLGEALCEEF